MQLVQVMQVMQAMPGGRRRHPIVTLLLTAARKKRIYGTTLLLPLSCGRRRFARFKISYLFGTSVEAPETTIRSAFPVHFLLYSLPIAAIG